MGEAVMRDREGLILELEHILRELIGVYEGLVASAAERIAAVRRSDSARLATVVGRENELVQRVAEIEKRRIGVVERLAERFGLTEKSGTRVGQLVERMDEPWRGRVAELAARLKGLLERMRRENEVSGRAVTNLAEHMAGLVRALTREMNHAKTYGRRGVMEAGPAVVSSVDVRS